MQQTTDSPKFCQACFNRTMAQEIERQMKKRGIKVNSIEGSKEADWTLVDLGDIIIHIVLETSRDNYSLEQLWKGECIEAKSFNTS